jgi:rare lipoprotein A
MKRPKSTKYPYYFLIFFLLSIGCSSSNKQPLHKNLSKYDAYNTKYQGHYKIGRPYKINSVTYTPYKELKKNHIEKGTASWYGKNDHNKKTANGDTFNKHLLTAAHPKLPMPCIIKVTNLNNNKAAILMVNDRGPFRKKRILDVSEAAAERLEFKHKGTAEIKLEYLHGETQKLLTKLNLEKKAGSKAKKKIQLANNCSVNCYMELLNAKHNLTKLSSKQKKLYKKSIIANNI